MNISSLQKKYLSQELSPERVLDEIYGKIENDGLNDFITLTKNIAYEEAYKSSKRYRSGNPLSKIDGIPVSLKDNFAVSGARMTCGSKILSDFISPYDATVAARIKDNGGLIVGKNNMDEFAMGSSNETSFYGPVKNPNDKRYVPGGSSGGSAASVKSGHSYLSVGSDTGGSVRQPAGFCGVVGFKPTYGLISRYGLTAFSSSLDTVGILSNDVADAAILFDILKGDDGFDSTIECRTLEKRDFKSIGYIEKIEHIDENVEKIYFEKVSELKNNGFNLVPVEMDFINESVSTYQIQTMCETSSNLARFDGIKYGLQIREGKTLFDIYSGVRGSGFGKEVKRRILTGTYFLTHKDGEYYDLSFKLRDYTANKIDELLSAIDVLMLPTSLTLPFKFNEKSDSPLKMHLSDSLTAFCNLTNVPAISINAGYFNLLPCGIQFVGRRYDDENLLAFAEGIEKTWSINE